MPWNEADRAKYDVIRPRYSTDMSEAELALIAPLLPKPKRRGRKPTDAVVSNRGKFPGKGGSQIRENMIQALDGSARP